MIKDKYLKKIKQEVIQSNKDNKVKFFIFGSSLTKDKFGDIDIGVKGRIDKMAINELKEKLASSTLPYNIDIVNFNNVSEEFSNNVLKNKVLWITR